MKKFILHLMLVFLLAVPQNALAAIGDLWSLPGIRIQSDTDILFDHTGGSTSDPDIEFDGYVRFDGTVEFDGTVALDGALTVNGAFTTTAASTLGNAIGDTTTFTGKIAGSTPFSFDGDTADTVYTILAITDPVSSSKTVTLPSITSSIALETVATTVITADTTATITIAAGTDVLYTYTIDTDNEDCTLTFSAGGTAGDLSTLVFITDTGGSGDEVMTFDGTLSDAEGTLTLANGTAKRYVIRFISDGTIWNELSRTAVLG